MPQTSRDPASPSYQVPVHIKLAQEFALMDKYYTSFPGPSTPNHLFIMSATSAGCTTTGEDYQCTSGKKFPQKTIFESLARQMTSRHCCQYHYRHLHHLHHHLHLLVASLPPEQDVELLHQRHGMELFPRVVQHAGGRRRRRGL